MMKNSWGRIVVFEVVLGLALGISACSSSKKNESENPPDELAPALDAGTDPVPQTNPEGSDPIADLGVPPPDAPKTESSPAPNPETPPPTPDTASATPPPSVSPPVADSAPPSTASTVASPSSGGSSGQFENYTVQSGDTLMKIAFENYGDLYRWKAIYEANRDKLPNANTIPAGTVLKLERPSAQVPVEKNGEKYLIKRGDTLGTISYDVYGTKSKWKKLWENNRQLIHDPNKIFAGFFLYYTLTPEEKQDADKLRQQIAPAPLAGNSQPVDPLANTGNFGSGTDPNANRAPGGVQGNTAPPVGAAGQ